MKTGGDGARPLPLNVGRPALQATPRGVASPALQGTRKADGQRVRIDLVQFPPGAPDKSAIEDNPAGQVADADDLNVAALPHSRRSPVFRRRRQAPENDHLVPVLRACHLHPDARRRRSLQVADDRSIGCCRIIVREGLPELLEPVHRDDVGLNAAALYKIGICERTQKGRLRSRIASRRRRLAYLIAACASAGPRRPWRRRCVEQVKP